MIQCLTAANIILNRLLEVRSFTLYSGDKDARKPLLYYLDQEFFHPSHQDVSGLHATITKSHSGYTRIKYLNTDDVGVIYTDDKRDANTLKKHIRENILNVHRMDEILRDRFDNIDGQ